LEILGEDFMLTEMSEFTEWVVKQRPYSPDFITAVRSSPRIFEKLFAQYLTKAASSSWETSNRVAYAAPSLDGPLATGLTDEQAFRFLAAISRGAELSGFGARELTYNAFTSLPNLRTKARAFAVANDSEAAAILNSQGVVVSFADFVSKYLS